MNFHDYLGIVWRKLWLVLLIMATAAFAVWQLGQPGTVPTTYSGSSTLTLVQGEAATDVLLYSYVATETSEISERVAADLGPDYFDEADFSTAEVIDSIVDVDAVPEIGTISLFVEDLESEADVEDVLGRYAEFIIEFARTRETAERDEELSGLDQRQLTLETEINSLQNRLDILTAAQSEEQRALGVSVDRVVETQQAAALSSLTNVLAEADSLRSRTAESLTPLRLVGPPTVVQQAGTTDPLGIQGRMIVGVGLAALLGIGLVISLNRFETRLYSRRDTEASFHLPVLAEVPKPSWRDRRRDPLISRSKPTHSSSEAYRLLRSSIDHRPPVPDMTPGTGLGTVVAVISPGSGTGRSTAAANLAIAAAAAGRRVLLVSADLRNPALHGFFGVEAGIGLSDAITGVQFGAQDLDRFTLRSGIEDLDLLLHGRELSNPGERLSQAKLVFDIARANYDTIVVDTPPMLVGNDVTELSSLVDFMVVVAKTGRTTIDEGRWMEETMSRLGLPVAGVLLHGATSELTRRGSLAKYGSSSRIEKRKAKKREAIAIAAPGAEPDEAMDDDITAEDDAVDQFIAIADDITTADAEGNKSGGVDIDLVALESVQLATTDEATCGDESPTARPPLFASGRREHQALDGHETSELADSGR